MQKHVENNSFIHIQLLMNQLNTLKQQIQAMNNVFFVMLKNENIVVKNTLNIDLFGMDYTCSSNISK